MENDTVAANTREQQLKVIETALRGAQEELRLLRMKDTASVYDPALRAKLGMALAALAALQQQSEPFGIDHDGYRIAFGAATKQEPICQRCGATKDRHRSGALAHHSECTLEEFIGQQEPPAPCRHGKDWPCNLAGSAHVECDYTGRVTPDTVILRSKSQQEPPAIPVEPPKRPRCKGQCGDAECEDSEAAYQAAVPVEPDVFCVSCGRVGDSGRLWQTPDGRVWCERHAGGHDPEAVEISAVPVEPVGCECPARSRETAEVERRFSLFDRFAAVKTMMHAYDYLREAPLSFVDRVNARETIADGIINVIDGRTTGREFRTARHSYLAKHDPQNHPVVAVKDRRCQDCGEVNPEPFSHCWQHSAALATPCAPCHLVGKVTPCLKCDGTGKDARGSACCRIPGHARECECAVCQWMQASYRNEREADSLREQVAHVQARFDKLYSDSMIGHRWFEGRFGAGFNGRDFAVKCPMADDAIQEQGAALRAQVAAQGELLREAERALASATE